MSERQKKVDFYTEIFLNPDRGEFLHLSELESNLDPAIDRNYKRLLPQDKKAKILDIGCGWGYFLYYLKQNGYSNIEGIDLSHHARRINFIKEHITKNASAIENPQDYLRSHVNEYDFIMLQQVIYYFKREDLLSIMSSLRDALKPEGLLVIETFNASLLTSVFVQNWDYERTLIFTEFSLAELLLDSGYKLKELFGM